MMCHEHIGLNSDDSLVFLNHYLNKKGLDQESILKTTLPNSFSRVEFILHEF